MSSYVLKPKDGELPPEKMEILYELHKAFEGNKVLINAYLDKFGWSKVISPNVRIIKREFSEHKEPEEEFKSSSSLKSSKVQEEENEPIKRCYYEIDAKCVFCGETLRPTLLRSKALIITYSYKNTDFPLFVPEAKSAIHGFVCEDPLVHGVVLCNNCLYASTSISNFKTDSAVSTVRGILSKNTDRKMEILRKCIKNDLEHRLRIKDSIDTVLLHKVSDDSVKNKTYIAYLLAARCSELLSEYDPAEYYRAADALLSAAKLASELEMESEELNHLRKAIPLLERSFEEGSVSALPLYLLGVIHYHLGDYLSSRTWLSRVLTDRGKLIASSKYKRYCENLNERIKKEKGA